MTRLMGIVNATPGLVLGPPQGAKPLDELAALAHRLGADLVDVGGESGRTDRPAVPVEQEIARVVPLVERLANDGLTVSVDTWRAPVARAALDAGATMVNDPSALSDEGVADACAEAGASLVITHTRVPPKVKGFPAYADVVVDVIELLGSARPWPRGAACPRAARVRSRHRPREDAGGVGRGAAPAARAGACWAGGCWWPCLARTSWAR